MTAFRILLGVLFINILIYTLVVGLNHGWDLFSVFFNDIMSLNWPGQFDVDFSSYLTLSALWIAWRHHFSGSGIAIALVALIMGMVVFAPYLLYTSVQTKGNMKELLVGKVRANS